MSEEAKVAYLQEKIHEARTNQRVAYVTTIVGTFFAVLFLGLMGVPEVIVFILAFIIFFIGMEIGYYYGNQKKKLIEQLKEMAFTEKIKKE